MKKSGGADERPTDGERHPGAGWTGKARTYSRNRKVKVAARCGHVKENNEKIGRKA
jgi:hypothetical protein